MPRVTTIDLGKLLATSRLTEAGGFRPLASQAILVQNTNRQAKAFSLAKDDLTSEAEVRATTQTTSASSTGSNENPGNRGNIENRGNSGNNENQGNSGKHRESRQ